MSPLLDQWAETARSCDLTGETVAYAAHCATFAAPYPPSSIAPYFCDSIWRELFAAMAARIHAGIEALSERYFAGDERLIELVQMPRHLAPLVHARHGYSGHHPVIRADCFVDHAAGVAHLLELNAADPSAYAWNDWLLRGLWRLESFGRLARERDLEPDWTVPAHARMVRRAHAEFHNARQTAKLSVALSIARESTVLFDFLCLERLYRDAGFDPFVVAPADFGAEMRRYDVIVRDTLDEVIAPDGTMVPGDLPDIIKYAKACVVNPTSSTFAEQKSVLPLLGADVLKSPVTTARGLRGSLPRTILVTEEAAAALADRARWVLKPAGGYGGYGVTIGAEATDDVWRAAVREALAAADPYVAQERVAAPRAPLLEIAANGTPLRRTLYANVSFWIIDGKLAGAFARLSERSIVNVHQGGALVPVVYVP